jgi:hypothetical protein
LLAPVQLIVEPSGVELEIASCITGPLRVQAEAETSLTDTILDAGSPDALAYADAAGPGYGGALKVRHSTVVGIVRAEVLTLVSNTVLHARSADGKAPVEARRRQEGCVRFSSLPAGSRVPRRYRCQPGQALENLASQLHRASSQDLTPAQRAQVLARVTPVFTSLRFGDPAYGQLSQLAPPEIRQGADDEAEMGAYHHLYQPQRLANLRTRLEEYRPFRLEAGIFCAT